MACQPAVKVWLVQWKEELIRKRERGRQLGGVEYAALLIQIDLPLPLTLLVHTNFLSYGLLKRKWLMLHCCCWHIMLIYMYQSKVSTEQLLVVMIQFLLMVISLIQLFKEGRIIRKSLTQLFKCS